MDADVLRQIWPIFSAEAREHLEAIGAGVLEIERGGASPAPFESIQRAAHSLKGSAASLGLGDLEKLAHACEDAVAVARAAGRIEAAAVEAVLRAVSAAEGALDRGGAGEAHVEGLPALLAALGGGKASPAAAGASAADRTAEPGKKGPGSAGSTGDRADRAVRVSAETLDSLASHVEMLALGEARTERRARELLALSGRIHEQLAAVSREAGAPGALARLAQLGRELARIGQDALRDSARQELDAASIRKDLRDLRMVPAAVALEPLRRTVREAAGRLHKEVELHISGGDIRLDRRVLQRLESPLVHLVRNAVDHGVEPPEARRAAGKPAAGRVEVRVESRGRRIGLVVSDDGVGLSAERIRAAAVAKGILPAEEAARLAEQETYRLLFAPGFSTASEITAISGRGVGLDVVQDAIARLQGTVQVSSVPGRGTSFDLDLPLTLAATTGILCRVAGEVAAVPADAVERVLRLGPADLGTVAGQAMARVASSQVPFASLAQVLGMPGGRPVAGEPRTALLLSLGGQRAALAVDDVLGEQEMVVSSLGRRAAGVAVLAGASVLDDGRVVAVLNAAELLRRGRPAAEGAQALPRARIVVADDSLTTRSAMKAVLEIAGFAVLPAADGEEAWELLADGRTQLLVADVQMPRLDGLALTLRLKADPRLRRIPVVLVTSLDAPEDRMAGLRAGADGYLVKREVEGGRLLELVRQLLPGPA